MVESIGFWKFGTPCLVRQCRASNYLFFLPSITVTCAESRTRVSVYARAIIAFVIFGVTVVCAFGSVRGPFNFFSVCDRFHRYKRSSRVSCVYESRSVCFLRSPSSVRRSLVWLLACTSLYCRVLSPSQHRFLTGSSVFGVRFGFIVDDDRPENLRRYDSISASP